MEIKLKDYSIILSEPIVTGTDCLDIKWGNGAEYSISSTLMTTKELIDTLDGMILV